MKQTFKFLTLSRVFNDCRMTVGRLSTLLLLLFALSFGFSSQAWASAYRKISNAKIVGNMPTCSWSSGSGWQLTTSDNNKWSGNFYIPHSSTNYEFDVWLKSNDDNWDGNRANCGFWFTFSAKNATDISCVPGSNMQIQCISKPTSGFINVYFEFWAEYSSDSKLWVEQSAVLPLHANLDPSSTSVASGSQLNMNPSLSGGSGSYNKQYSASPNIGSFDGDNYKAPMVLSNTNVTITLEVSDANGQLSGLAHKTITKQITITPPTGDLYIKHPWGDGKDQSWSWQKMEKVSDGNYKFSGNYGGTGCNINAIQSDKGSKWFGNEDDGYYVTNTPDLNDKCWFTLSYSDGKLTVAPKTYTLTLDGNGGMPETQDVTVTYGKGCPSFITPEKTGYNYGGFLKPNTTATLIINSGSQTFAKNETDWTSNNNWVHDDNATIKARWTAKNITIKFDNNSGEGTAKSDIATQYDVTVTLPSNDFTRTGYAPNGWNTAKDGTGTHYNSGASVRNINEGGTITLYAEWTPNQTIVTLDKNGGEGENKRFTATFDALINVGETTPHQRTGYTLQQYNNESTEKVLNADLTARTTDLTGWISRKTVSGVANSYWANPNPSATLYAVWKANSYTITLHYENGTDNTENKSVTFDATATAVTPPIYGTNVFEGYFTEATGGTKVIEANGSFALNADGYTSGGKWVKAQNVDLYAHWITRTQCTITYGITDGSASASGRGAINAKIGSGAATSTGTLSAYTGDEVTISFEPKRGQYYNTNNGYKENGWYDAISGGNLLKVQCNNSYTFTVTGNASVYVKADPVVYTISTAVSPASTTQYPDGGAGMVTPTSGEAGPDIALQLTAEEKAGYDWANWTLSDNTNGSIVAGTATDKTISVAAKTAGFTATANFSAHNYTITYTGLLDGSTHADNPATYTIESETITFNPATSVFGHKFTSWNPETITTGSTGDKTITAQYGAVSLAPVASENIIEGKQATITPTLTAPAGSYYYEYTCASIATFNVGANGVATFNAPAAGNYTITLNVYEGASNTGVLLATTDINITVEEDLSTNWKLVGDNQSGSPFGDNYTYDNGKPMTKAPGHSTENIAYYSLNVTTLGTFEFKVAKGTGNENFYGWGQNDGDYITFNRDASGTEMQVYSGNQHPLKFTPDMVGEYVFKVDYTTNDVVKVTVTYPTTTTYNVDIYYDGVTKTTVEGGAFAKSITAQVPESMIFDHWEVEGETTHVNITDVNSQTTTFTASGTGAVIRAKFKVVSVMYLKAGDVFGDAYVNFYSKDGYWSDDKGSGNKGNNCMSKNNHMTKIARTDIYYLDVSGGIDNWTWEQAFSFVNKSVEHDNFSMCNVVYRSDYNDRLPLYVPRYGWITDYFIECHYYNDGIWMKYNDTYSGYKLWIKEKNAQDATAQDVTLNALTPGGYEFNTKLNLKSGTTYELKIHNENGEWYGVSNQTITATSCTNWHFWKGNNNCQLTTSEAGDYTFVLNLGSGEVIVSVEYPLSNDDYRVVAKQSSEVKWEGDLIKNSGSVAKKDTTSFFNDHYTYQLQQYAGAGKWSDVGGEVTITDDKAQVGVINLIVEQDGQGNATLTYEGVYKGNFYIRTDGVDGGWGSYKTNPDNKMDNYGSLLVADPTYQYDVYKAKWVLSGKNVKFRIANDYSKAISDELKEDAIIDNKETLPQGANVRFMWNSKTNQLKRAYISGSTDTKDRYLVLTGDAKMFDNEGNVIPVGTAANHREGLLENELPFKDMNNWVYQADIKAQPQCAVKLTAKYNNQVQYFIGAAGEGTGSRKTIIAGNGETQYTMRVVYDFKTNLLIAGWVPDGKEITDTIKLGGDMLISRTHQDSAQQIIFGTTGSIEDIHHIYGVLSIKKDTMLGKGDAEKGAKYTTVATNADYDRTMYWVSFPFKVKISEIFGVDGYGTKWIMQKYRGDLRAQKGWFKEDTPTFWEFMDVTDSLNAYEGYLFLIDANYFNTEDADVWKNSATEANFYFPSASGNIGIINKSEYTQKVPAHECGIDREFEVQGVGKVNHKITDSYWNVIGVPAFQNKSLVLGSETETDMKAIYEWNSTNNTYTPKALADEFRFQTMHAYMVQFGGDITWSNVSVVNNNPTPAQGGSAPRYTYADTKNYFIKLFFGNTEAEDHAYINLADEASTDFVLNEDMMKLDNAGYPNIYSFAGNYNVAYNETKMTNQSVTIGVSAPKNGSYTFSMPKDFSGSAILVDLEEGTTTDLNVSNYSVDLNKGTYNNRFQLMLEVEVKTPTAIDNANGEWNADGKTKKLFINDQIYLINGGRVYNATGVQLR